MLRSGVIYAQPIGDGARSNRARRPYTRAFTSIEKGPAMMIFTTSADASINNLVSIVLPTSTNRDVFCGVCLQIEKAFRHHAWEYEIVPVDDGQSEAARIALEQLPSGRPSRVRFQEFDQPVTRQQALMAGIIAVKGKVIVLLDEVPRDFAQQLASLVASLDEAYSDSNPLVSVQSSDEGREVSLSDIYRDHWSQVA